MKPETVHRNPWDRLRPLFWPVFLALTPLLLTHPVWIRISYQQVETTAVLPDILRFGVLFVVWGTALLAIALTGPDDNLGGWPDVLLLNVFVLVFWNFWNLATPLGGGIDSLYNNSIVRNLLERGTIARPAPPNFLYLEFPGLHLVAAGLALVTGLNDLRATWLLRLLFVQLYVTILYAVLSLILGSRRKVLLGAFALVVGALVPASSAHAFAPSVYGSLILALAWLIIVPHRQQDLQTASHVMFALTAGALIVSYFVNSMMLLGIAAAVCVLPTLWHRPDFRWRMGWIGLLLLVVAAGTWYLYWAHTLFLYAVTQFWRSFGLLFPGSVLESGIAKVPLWAGATRLVWLASIGLSSCIALIRLSSVRALTSQAEWLTAWAFLGATVVSVLAATASGGGYQFFRFLAVAPLFAFPLALGWKPGLPIFLRGAFTFPRLTIIAWGALIWVTMFPSFLLAPRDIGSVATYPWEIAISDFVMGQFGTGDRLEGYSIAVSQSTPLYAYGSPETTLVTDDPLQPTPQFWNNARRLVRAYLVPSSDSRLRTFLWNDKARAFMNKQGIAPNDPNWSGLVADLDMSNRVYSNGPAALYTR